MKPACPVCKAPDALRVKDQAARCEHCDVRLFKALPLPETPEIYQPKVH